jgi:structural maintenance of chromosome 1
MTFQLESKIKENSEQLRKVKQQLEAQQSERTRIKYDFDRVIMGVCSSWLRYYSRDEAELNERLLEVHQKLMQAGFDQKETEREAKLKETLSNLQRIFPGT